jgi:hypothetical protein
MAWTAGITRATGYLVTAANWNSYLGADGSLDFLRANYLSHDYYTVIDNYANGSTTGFTIVEDGAGHVYRYSGRLHLVSSTTDEDAIIQPLSPDMGYFVPTAGKKFVFIWGVRGVSAATAFELWLCEYSAVLGAPPVVTTSHVGFFANATAIYATNAAGAAQTITTTGVAISDAVQFLNLKAVWTYGTDIKFYVNGVLKVTHTTNIPTLNTTHLYNSLAFRSKAASAITAYVDPTAVAMYEGE